MQVRQLGEGSYGKVKLVLNLQDMRLYAIKFVSKKHLRSSLRFVPTFMQTSRMWAVQQTEWVGPAVLTT